MLTPLHVRVRTLITVCFLFIAQSLIRNPETPAVSHTNIDLAHFWHVYQLASAAQSDCSE